MDDIKRNTLLLIVEASTQLPVTESAKQLLHVVREYVDAYDMVEARRIIKMIPIHYYRDFLHSQALNDSILRDDVAALIEVLGHDFWLFSVPAASS